MLNHLSKIFLVADLVTNCLLVITVCFLVSCSGSDHFSETVGNDGLKYEQTILISNLIDVERQETKASLGRVSDITGIKCLDIFVFDDDELSRIDSYIHYDLPQGPYQRISSGKGDKHLVVLANVARTYINPLNIRNLEQLESLRYSLKDEDPSFPVMSGEAWFLSGEQETINVHLSPLISNICLDFVKVNFSGRGYKSRTLENASVYLTNVSGSAEILRNDGFRLNELVNASRLDESYLSTMRHPEMLYSRFTPGQWKAVNLYCYPNDIAEGVLGSENTRLVVQGDIDGSTYYYPIEINQEGFGYSGGPLGVGRAVKYSYSLTITRKGSSSPDTPLPPEEEVKTGRIELFPGQFITGKDGDKVHIWCELYPHDTPLDICIDDLEYDVARGIYSYELDEDGHGVTLTLLGNGSGMFTIDAGPPINQGFLVIVVVNP